MQQFCTPQSDATEAYGCRACPTALGPCHQSLPIDSAFQGSHWLHSHALYRCLLVGLELAEEEVQAGQSDPLLTPGCRA